MSDLRTLYENAESSLKDHDYEGARLLCTEAIDIIAGQGPERALLKQKLKFLFLLSDVFNQQGKWFDSIMFLEQAINLASEMHDRRAEAIALIKIGDIFAKKSNWDKAMAKYEGAERIVRNFENKTLLGQALTGKGIVSWRTGNNSEAIHYGKTAMQIGEEGDDNELAGKAASLISSAYYDLADAQRSIDFNILALEHYRKTDKEMEVVRVLNNLGETYKIEGDYEKAIETFNEGLEILKTRNNPREEGYYRANLAECNLGLDKLKEADVQIGKAEELLKGLEDKYGIAFYTGVQASIEDAKGNNEKAWKLFARSEELLNEQGIPFDTGQVRLKYARSLRAAGKDDEARVKYTRAINAFQEAGTKSMVEKAKRERDSD